MVIFVPAASKIGNGGDRDRDGDREGDGDGEGGESCNEQQNKPRSLIIFIIL